MQHTNHGNKRTDWKKNANYTDVIVHVAFCTVHVPGCNRMNFTSATTPRRQLICWHRKWCETSSRQPITCQSSWGEGGVRWRHRDSRMSTSTTGERRRRWRPTRWCCRGRRTNRRSTDTVCIVVMLTDQPGICINCYIICDIGYTCTWTTLIYFVLTVYPVYNLSKATTLLYRIIYVDVICMCMYSYM